MPETKNNVYQRISLVMGDLDGKVEKSGKITFGSGYNFVTIADLTNLVRRAMVVHGLVIVADLIVEDRTGKGLVQTYRFKLVNIDKPEDFVEAQMTGTANDQKSQASGVCLSYATKNFLLKTFCLAGDDDKAPAKDRDAEVEQAEFDSGSLVFVKFVELEKIKSADGKGDVPVWTVGFSDSRVAMTVDEAVSRQAENLLGSGKPVKFVATPTASGNLNLTKIRAAN